MLDWTARRPVVVPLAGSRESLSGHMLYRAVAQELKLPSLTCFKMRPQRPWLPYVHKDPIFDSSLIVPRSHDASCKHLLAQTLVYHVIEEPQAAIPPVEDSDSDSDGEVILIIERTFLVLG